MSETPRDSMTDKYAAAFVLSALTGAAVDVKPNRGEEQCDFCSATPPVMAYPCRDHVMGDLGPGLPAMASKEPWAACETCHQLIQRSDREGLALHSARRYRQIHGGDLKDHLPILRQVHDIFWSNREGAPVTISEHLKGGPA